MSGKERQQTCRYCRRQYIGKKEIQCLVEKTPRSISAEDCEKCQKYRSKYIQFPISISGIENQQIPTEPEGICRWVRIRPCSSKFEDRTYLGIFLGTLPIGISTSYEENTGKLSNHAVCNPAILVPDLKKILYGMESWWDFIETPEELKELTDASIDQMWYAQLARTFGMDIAKKDMVENGEKTSH